MRETSTQPVPCSNRDMFSMGTIFKAKDGNRLVAAQRSKCV
jgi:hypothetical protein